MTASTPEHSASISLQAATAFSSHLCLAGRLLLAAVFILAGALKVIDPIGFARSIADYDLLPDRVVPIVAVVLPWWEVAASVFAIGGRRQIPALTVLTGLSAVFLVVGAITVTRGLSAECGCFGFLSERVGPASLSFEALLLAVGVLLLWRKIRDSQTFGDQANLAEKRMEENKVATKVVIGGGQRTVQSKANKEFTVTDGRKSQEMKTKSNPKEIPTMNDPIKYLITGAAIAVVCGAAGVTGGVWLMKEMNSQPQVNKPPLTISGKPSPITIQPANVRPPNNQSIFNSQRMPQNPVITIPPRPPGSNIALHPMPPTGKMPITYNQFQKLQDLPEVKAARDAFMEAQKKYSETMKKAVESGQGAVASAPKITPVTIQLPASGNTNGVGKTAKQ